MDETYDSAATERVRAYKASLAELSECLFASGQYFSCHSDGISLVLMPLDGAQTHHRHLLVLTCGIPPDVKVQEVPFGLVANGELETVGITDGQGQCIVALPSKNYRAHFVVEVENRIDAEIIVRLGDDSLMPLVHDVLDDEEAPVELREDIRELLSIAHTANVQVAARTADFWAGELQPELAGKGELADGKVSYPVSATAEWQSPDGSFSAELDLPRWKLRSGNTTLTMVFYDQSGKVADDFHPEQVKLGSVDAVSIESGRALFVWEEIPLDESSFTLIVNQDAWDLVEATIRAQQGEKRSDEDEQ